MKKKLKKPSLFLVLVMASFMLCTTVFLGQSVRPLYAQAASTTYTVTFIDGANSVHTETIEENNTVSSYSYTKSGYDFVGWYEDSSFVKEYDFTKTVNSSFNLYAKFATTPGVSSYNFTLLGSGSTNVSQISSKNVVTIDNSTFKIDYKITENAGVCDLLLIPDYDKSIFELKSISVNGNTAISVDGWEDETASSTEVLKGMGIATISESSTWVDEDAKILLGNLSASSPSYTGVSGTNEVFLSLVYTITSDSLETREALTSQDYTFGFKTETGVQNGYTAAFHPVTENNPATLSRMNFTSTPIELVLQKEGSVTIDEDQSFTYSKKAALAGTAAAANTIVYSYTASADNPTVTSTWSTDDETYTSTAPINAGTYYLKLNVAESAYYSACETSEEFTIDSYVVSDVVLSASTTSVQYTGSNLCLGTNGSLVVKVRKGADNTYTLVSNSTGSAEAQSAITGIYFGGTDVADVIFDTVYYVVNESDERVLYSSLTSDDFNSTDVATFSGIEVRFYVTNANYSTANYDETNEAYYISATTSWAIVHAENSWTEALRVYVTEDTQMVSVSTVSYSTPYDVYSAALFGTPSYTYSKLVSSSWTLLGSKPVDEGYYKVVASVTGTTNYQSLSATVQYSISATVKGGLADSDISNFTVSSKTFNGGEQTWVYTDVTLPQNAAYTIDTNYENSVSGTYANTYSLTIYLKANQGTPFGDSTNGYYSKTYITLTATMNPLVLKICSNDQNSTYGSDTASSLSQTLSAKYYIGTSTTGVSYTQANQWLTGQTTGDSLSFNFSVVDSISSGVATALDETSYTYDYLNVDAYPIFVEPVFASTSNLNALKSSYTLTYEYGDYTVSKNTSTSYITLSTISDIYYFETVSCTPSSSYGLDNISYSYVKKVNNTYGSTYTALTLDSTILDAGTYKIKATIPETSNYAEGSTTSNEFVVNKAVLKPVVVTLSYDTNGCGTATWDKLTDVYYSTSDTTSYATIGDDVVSYSVTYNTTTTNNVTSFTANASATYTITASAGDNFASSEKTLTAYSVEFIDEVSSHSASQTTPSNIPSPATLYVFDGQSVTSPEETPSIVGYVFNVWKNGNNAYTFGDEINADLQLKTSWTINTFVITWKNWEGTTTIYSGSVDYGSVPTFQGQQSNLEKAANGQYSYTFKGWNTLSNVIYENESSVLSIPAATQTATYYIVYQLTAVSHSIIFNYKVDTANAYSTYVGPNVVVNPAYNTSVLTALQQAGYGCDTFTQYKWFRVDGWYTDSARTQKVTNETLMPDTTLQLYAAYVFDVGMGDVNGDGKIGADDLSSYRKWIVGGYTFTVIPKGNEWNFVTAQNFAYNPSNNYFLLRVADINNDNAMDIRDISTIRMAIVGGYGYSVLKGVVEAQGGNSQSGASGNYIVVGSNTVVSTKIISSNDIDIPVGQSKVVVDATTNNANPNTSVVTFDSDVAIDTTKPVEINSDLATITFDVSSAQQNFNVSNKDSILEISKVAFDSLASEQTKNIDNAETAYYISLNLIVGSTPIHNLGGTVTIKLGFDGAVAGQKYIVYYVQDDGSVTDIEAIGYIESQIGYIIFTTTHFSLFAVPNYVAYITVDNVTTNYSSIQEAFTSVESGQTINITRDLNNIGSLNLKAGVTLEGNNNTISGLSSININALGGTIQNVVFDNIHDNVPYSQKELERYGLNGLLVKGKLTPVYAYGLSGTATIDGCTFTGSDWDSIQVTPVAGGNVVITDNTFTADYSYNQKRYIHIESAKNVNFSATITGNSFTFDEDIIEAEIEVYYPTVEENVVIGNNTFYGDYISYYIAMNDGSSSNLKHLFGEDYITLDSGNYGVAIVGESVTK